MFDRQSEFFTLSRKVAERFLQSAVLVDDGAVFGGSPMKKPPSELVTPGRHRPGLADVDILERTAGNDAEAADDKVDTERLNAKKVIDSFARQGIVCSVLRPTKEEREGWWDTVEMLAGCADIIILDWTLYKDAGKRAQKIIRQIVRSSKEGPDQLRLIVVYTASPRIIDISRTINDILVGIGGADAEGDCDTCVQEEDDGLVLKFAAARITVLAKYDTDIPKQYRNHVEPFDRLADRVVEEFTAMTAGLVSNVVLQAIAKVRANTHRILYQFSADLDAPYLTHRSLLERPDEAEYHLTTLVAEELQAILEEAQVGSQADLETCRVWLQNKKDTGSAFSLRLKPGNDGQPNHKELTVEELIHLLEVGLKSWTCEKVSKRIRKKARTLPLTETFQADGAGPQDLDEKFAVVATMRAHYEQHVPRLTLGTIIKEKISYLVCIQPLCDCVRIAAKDKGKDEPGRVFPFLPLSTEGVEKKGVVKGFDIVVKEEDRYVRLLIGKKPSDLRLIRFCPCEGDNGVIAAKKQGEAYEFKDTSQLEYRWVGELRRDHAQRLSDQFATALSRVGLFESEWLRLWAKKGQQ